MDQNGKCNVDEGCTRRIKRFQGILNSSTQDLITRAKLVSGETVLDLGCGDGAVSLMLAELVGKGGRVYAIDMDEKKLVRLEEHAASRGFNNIIPLHGLAEDILPTLETIDVVYSRFLLMHVDTPQLLLGDMRKILSDRGRAILEEPIIRVTYDYPSSGVWERAIAAYRELCVLGNIDPDYGLRLPKEVAASRFDVCFVRQVQPVLSVADGRDYLIAAVEEHLEDYIVNGILSPQEYGGLLDAASAYGDRGADYCAFHGVMQVIGKKGNYYV